MQYGQCLSCKNTYGGWYNFLRRHKEGWSLVILDKGMDGHTCKGMVHAKMFYGGMVLFSGGIASPLNLSTVLSMV